MKIYVDELPKCCLECQLECPYEDRCVDTITMNCSECIGRPKDCPLQSLSDYTKQVRNEVCEEIKSLGEPFPYKQDDKPYMWIIGQNDLDNILE